ncbi:hypothetical protein ACHWQZ_G010908 [Mnemiopsis leidyi]
MTSFAITSRPVTDRFEKLKSTTFQIFPESVFRYKQDALNHKDVKVISLLAFDNLSVFVFDKIHKKLWSLSNATVIKVQTVPSCDFNDIREIVVDTIVSKAKLTGLFALDRLDGKEHSIVHVIKIGREAKYLQGINIPVIAETFLLNGGSLVVLTADADMLFFSINTVYKQQLQENGKRSRKIFCAISITKAIKLSHRLNFKMFVLVPSRILLYNDSRLMVYNKETSYFEVSIRHGLAITAIAKHTNNPLIFYTVLRASRNTIRTMQLSEDSLEEVADPIVLKEEIAFLKSGLQGILYIVTKKDQILVHTNLDFAINLWKAVQNGYTSCGFISDKISAKNAVKPTNKQAKMGISQCCQFLEGWDKKKKAVLGKQSVQGKDGSICSSDVECLIETKKAMEINLDRLKSLQCHNLQNVHIYTMFSEAHAEHGFGNMPFGTSRSLLDFATGMRNASLNMLLRYVKTNFSQPAEYRKAYLEPENEPVLDVDELTEMMADLKPLIEKSPRYHVVSSHIKSSGDVDNTYSETLREALNIARSQPRRTTRQYYKESAGYAPQVLEEQHPDFLFQKHDVVAHENIDGTIGIISVSVNLTKNEFEKNGSIVGNRLVRKDETLEYNFAELITVKSKFLLRDRLGSYLTYDSGYSSCDENIYLSGKFLSDVKSAHVLT